MQRSVGLILSALILGISALGMLLFTVLMVFAGVALKTHPPAMAPPPFTIYVLYATGLVFAAIAAWAIITIVGLLFLRVWARYSILVIGGLLAITGVLALFGTLIALVSGQFRIPGAHPGLTNQQMQIIFAFVALFYGAIGAIGVWWLVYFNLRSVKDLFLHRGRYDPASGLLLPPSPSRRPTAITILGCLYLLGAPGCVVMAFLPFPAFIFGFILTGSASHALYAGFAILAGAIGVGLLRLYAPSRIAAIASLAVGCLNTLLGLLPWYQRQFNMYMEQFRAIFPINANAPQNAFQYSFAQMALYGAFGLALNIFLIWLLHRHRAAFSPPPSMESA